MLRIEYGDVRALPTEAEGFPLSDYRLRRLEHLRPTLSRRQSIGAELLLIHALRASCGEIALPLSIETGEKGKPRLLSPLPEISLSHSGTWAACAVCDRPVGLDVQELRPCREELLTRFFAPEERLYILGSKDRDAAFTELWCQKESWVKALGTGLSTPFASFSVLDPALSARIWHIRRGELFFAVCVLSGDATPDCVIQVPLP